MGLVYQTVLWNKQKKIYDKIMFLLILLYLLLFIGITFLVHEETSIETLVIRAFGTLAILLLHIILCIGPLARLNTNFLPLLYNRRHLGVSMFLIATIHGVFSLIQFHGLGDVNIITSLFTSNLDYASLINFPFEILGFFGLLILFVMAATSHDFWLANLKPIVWKRIHMTVYIAYLLIVLHVFLGAYQQETSFITSGLFIVGFIVIASLHIIAGIREVSIDKLTYDLTDENWQFVCDIEEIEIDRAKIFVVGNERVAIFKYDNKLSAVHNVCKHQGGPLGEGKVVDGCITCPWHGYQYLPQNGKSPAPFSEKVSTYQLKLEKSKIYILPKALPEGTEVAPLIYELSESI
jgi:nitrite reductase/ring-hydroxylating ferredoxin subunit/DMSO/TMAO reductase YedYZ heme-binding membrane subunit